MTLKNGADFSLKGLFRADNTDKADAKTGYCPDDAKLAEYISNGIISGSERENIAAHITECETCFEKVASALSVMRDANKDRALSVSKPCLRRILSMPRKYPNKSGKRTFLKRNAGLFAGTVFFILSFIFKAYFLQFLAAAVILGLKWVMDTGSTRALIMIYETWKRNKENHADLNKEGFMDRRHK